MPATSINFPADTITEADHIWKHLPEYDSRSEYVTAAVDAANKRLARKAKKHAAEFADS